jgi:hypothetical protein
MSSFFKAKKITFGTLSYQIFHAFSKNNNNNNLSHSYPEFEIIILLSLTFTPHANKIFKSAY